MTTTFRPTHRIETDRQTICVMLTDDGVAYQQCEWDSETSADYTLTDDGRWVFQGQAFNGRVYELTEADRTQWLYREAEARVRGDDRLTPHAATILEDHGDGDDHWRWVIDADADEILDWAKARQ